MVRTYQSGSGFNAVQTAAENHVANYWRKRLSDMLARFENEARRMFQLEAELSQFAAQYYEVVGSASERLAQVEHRAATVQLDHCVVQTMPDIIASKATIEVREQELKQRYRSLAKEIHPDKASITLGTGVTASHMQALNAAYRQRDLAGLLKVEAEMVITSMIDSEFKDVQAIENALRELDRATNTYAEGYRALLNSPINELMLRAMSARLAGWDWMQAVVRKVERTIEEKERAMIEASIAEISQWRADVMAVA